MIMSAAGICTECVHSLFKVKGTWIIVCSHILAVGKKTVLIIIILISYQCWSSLYISQITDLPICDLIHIIRSPVIFWMCENMKKMPVSSLHIICLHGEIIHIIKDTACNLSIFILDLYAKGTVCIIICSIRIDTYIWKAAIIVNICTVICINPNLYRVIWWPHLILFFYGIRIFFKRKADADNA